MRKRTLGRELALQALYELDSSGGDTPGDLPAWLSDRAPDPEVIEFARELVTGVWERRAGLDAAISDVARNWEIRRMAVVDRNVLRIGAFELLHRPDVPPLVAINEAIELAKRFSTKQSGAFVNGILDAIRAKRPDGPELPREDQSGA